MVTTTESSSSSNHHSPPSMAGDFPRKNLPSPWAQVVRGVETESTAGARQSPPLPPSSSSSSSSLGTSTASAPDQQPPSSSPDPSSPVSPPAENYGSVAAHPDASDCGDGNAGRYKKQAWNKPSNGVVSEAGPVMDAESWPALSESAKASGKFAADSSSKTVTVDEPLSSTPQDHVTPQSPQRLAISHANAKTSPTNYNMPNNRQRTMKRGGGSSIGPRPTQSGFSNPPQPPLPPPFPAYQLPQIGYGNVVPRVPHHSPSDHYRHNNWDARQPVGGFVPGMNEHRGSSRRGNFGPHPCGYGSSYRNNNGGRRNQDRASFGNSRDAHVHQPRIHQMGSRHPPTNTIVGPPPIGPYGNPMGLHDLYYVPVEHFRSMPLYTRPPAMYFPAESPLTDGIVKQIEYYFSDANLVKDEYLRSNMDEQGWVPITLIANFPRVKGLTTDIQLILDSLRYSIVVEVQGDKVRRHNEWMRWLPAAHLRRDFGSVSPGRFNNLAADFQSIALEEATKDEDPTKSSIQPQVPNDADATVSSN